MDFSHELCPIVLNSLPEHIAIVNSNGSIEAVNSAWETYTKCNGGSVQQTGVGNNYLRICDQYEHAGSSDARNVKKGLRKVLENKTNHFS